MVYGNSSTSDVATLLQPTRIRNNRRQLLVKPRHTHGFTIVEILVVILILGILMGIVFQTITTQVASSQLRQATSQVVADLERVRSSSLKTSKDSSFAIDAGGTSYTLTLNGVAGTKSMKLPDNIVLTSTAPVSATTSKPTITYSAPYGTVNAVGATFTVTSTTNSSISKQFYLLGVTGKVVQ